MVKVQNGRYFFGLLKIQIFFGVLEIPDIFLGCTVDAGLEPTYTEKMRVPPPGDLPTLVNDRVISSFQEGFIFTKLCN